MKFLWVIKWEWRHPGPIVHVSLRNAHALASLGYETHFVLGAGEQSDTAEDISRFYGLEQTPFLHVHRVKRQALMGSRAVLNRALALARELRAQGEERITVVTRDTTFLPALVRLLDDGKFRLIYEAHDFFARLELRESRPTLREHRLALIENTMLKKISGLLAITPGQCELYREYFPGLKILALPLGTEPDRAEGPDVNEGGDRVHLIDGKAEGRLADPLLVYVGHLNSYKGTKLLTRAARKIYSRTGCRTAFWGGSEKQILRLRKSAIKKKQLDYTEVRGFMPPEELHRLLSTRATLGALPLLDTLYNRRLTCPVKALDYISHGLPVLASDLPTNRWLLEDAALYHTAGDLQSFVDSVIKALEPHTYKALAAASLRRARDLSYRKRARAIVQFAKQLHGL